MFMNMRASTTRQLLSPVGSVCEAPSSPDCSAASAAAARAARARSSSRACASSSIWRLDSASSSPAPANSVADSIADAAYYTGRRNRDQCHLG